jgi:hypothetical protein
LMRRIRLVRFAWRAAQFLARGKLDSHGGRHAGRLRNRETEES